MQNQTKRQLTKEEAGHIVSRAFGSKAVLLTYKELNGGWANAAYAIETQDGSRAVIKIAPQVGDTLYYERDIMRAEAEVMQIVQQLGGVPMPELLLHDNSLAIIDREYVVMSFLEGQPYNEVRDQLSEKEREVIERQIGQYNRRMNQVRGDRFGYYSQPAVVGQSWREAFSHMLDKVLEDGQTANVVLPATYEEIAARARGCYASLDEVKEPVLLHWDLWDGNVFVQNGVVTGIIDFERALWGDPLMEFYFSHFKFDHQKQSRGFWQGYYEDERALGSWTEAERVRRSLYNLYMDLIMYIECPYRQYSDEDHIAWAKKNVEDGWQAFVQTNS